MNALYLKDICKNYDKEKVLKNISFTVQKGEIVGLLGPNGAGKTTLLRIIAGLSKPSAGDLEIFGLKACDRDAEMKKDIGLVMQDNNMEREFTVWEALYYYARLYGVKNPALEVECAIKAFGMNEWKDRRIDKLSGGMARRAMIARATLPAPQLLLMDEPSVGLDPDARLEIWNEVRKLKAQGKTIIITTHYMDEAEALCDRIAILKNGELLGIDTAASLKNRVSSAGEYITLEKAFLHFIGKEAI